MSKFKMRIVETLKLYTLFRFGQDVYRLDLTNMTWKLLVNFLFSQTKVLASILLFLRPVLVSPQCTGTSTQQLP